MPTEPCNVHGEPRTRLVRDLPAAGDLPRAELAVDIREVTPVIIRTPALLADKDPYNSVKPTLKPEPEPEKEAGQERKKVDSKNRFRARVETAAGQTDGR